MKVLERNEPFPDWPRQMRCEHCGSLLAVDATDVTMPGQREGGNGWFVCPVCRLTNHLTEPETREAGRALRFQRGRS